MEKKLYRRIEIIPVIGGWIVQVGCKKIVYADALSEKQRMADDLLSYLTDPKRTEANMLDRNCAFNDAGVALAPDGPPYPTPPDMSQAENRAYVGPHTEIRPLGPNMGDVRNCAVRTGEETSARDEWGQR
jgi:hypothetical protein